MQKQFKRPHSQEQAYPWPAKWPRPRHERTLAALKTEVQARAGALEENKRRLDDAKENLKKSQHQFEQFKPHQLRVLNAHQSKDEAAREEAEKARQYARNLDDSLRGKNRDQNRINRANRDAKGKEIDFQKKRAEHEAKVDEYNRAMAHQESTLKEGEDSSCS